MKVKISINKDGKELASEEVSTPQTDEITNAIGRVLDEVRKSQEIKELWPCQIDIRHAD